MSANRLEVQVQCSRCDAREHVDTVFDGFCDEALHTARCGIAVSLSRSGWVCLGEDTYVCSSCVRAALSSSAVPGTGPSTDIRGSTEQSVVGLLGRFLVADGHQELLVGLDDGLLTCVAYDTRNPADSTCVVHRLDVAALHAETLESGEVSELSLVFSGFIVPRYVDGSSDV